MASVSEYSSTLIIGAHALFAVILILTFIWLVVSLWSWLRDGTRYVRTHMRRLGQIPLTYISASAAFVGVPEFDSERVSTGNIVY